MQTIHHFLREVFPQLSEKGIIITKIEPFTKPLKMGHRPEEFLIILPPPEGLSQVLSSPLV